MRRRAQRRRPLNRRKGKFAATPLADADVQRAAELWAQGVPMEGIKAEVAIGTCRFWRMRRENPELFPARSRDRPGPTGQTEDMLRQAAQLRARGAEWPEIAHIMDVPQSRLTQAICRNSANRALWERELAEAKAAVPANGAMAPLSRRARERRRKLGRTALMRLLGFNCREVGRELGFAHHTVFGWMKRWPDDWRRAKDEARETLKRYNAGEQIDDDDVARLIRKAASRVQPSPQTDTVTLLAQQVTELTRQVAELKGNSPTAVSR